MAGLVPGHDPGDVVQLRLVVRQVRERDAGQQLVDPLLQHPPDRPDAARRVRTTSLGIDRVEIAVDFEGDVLRGLDHVLHADVLRWTREVIPAFGSAHRVHEPGPPQPQQDLDRKSTRLNSSHGYISYAVFCLKKKKSKRHSTYAMTLLDTTALR